MFWLVVVAFSVLASSRYRWFRNALTMILPVCQGWSLLAEDINENGAADAIEVIIVVATNATGIVEPTVATFREAIGSSGFFFFVAVIALVTLLVSMRIVSLFQASPRRAIAFFVASFVFFMLIPQLNGRSHWKAHFELLLVIFTLLAAAEYSKEANHIKTPSWQKHFFVFARNLTFAAFVWTSMVRRAH